MERLEMYDIDEDELRNLLHEIPNIWSKNRGFFDAGIKLVFSNFGEQDNLLFGVHIYSHSNGARIFVILTEFLREAQVAVFNINAFNTAGWFAPSRFTKGEIKFKEMLQRLTYEELEEISASRLGRRSAEIFICPHCKALYYMHVLHVSEDGRVECQNCKSRFDPIELDVAKRSAAHDS